MNLIESVRAVALERPVLIASFLGWVDAAGVGTGAAAHLAADAPVIARYDGDALIDFRARRPELDIVDGVLKDLSWPEITIRAARIGGRDLLILTGPEPDFRWRAFAEQTVAFAKGAEVVEMIAVGAIGSAVPHTRATGLLATAADTGLLDEGETVPEGLLRVPAAAVSAVESAFAAAGVPARGIWAQVPHYVAGPFAQGIIAVLERLGAHLGISIALGSLPEEAAAQRARIDDLVADRPDVRDYIDQLEKLTPTTEVPSGDEIAAEIERFLRGADGPDAR